MNFSYKIINKILKSIIEMFRPLYNKASNKYSGELLFWKTRHEIDNGVFNNSHYKRYMLAMAEEENENFLNEKIVADFGCGPRGSLSWTKKPSLRIGIDVLADKYAHNFKEDIISHKMIYLKSTETVIPLPTNFVDVMFTLNAMDHVDSFNAVCNEIIRVLKPGGDFIGSFNLEESPSLCEPQCLNEEIINENLLRFLDVKSYRITNRGPDNDPYKFFFTSNLRYDKGHRGLLWVNARNSVG